MNQHTSFELSKKLWENGCRLESEYYWRGDNGKDFVLFKGLTHEECDCFPTYDLLWDICVKHAKKFFGTGYELNIIANNGMEIENHYLISEEILEGLKNGADIKKIEEFIWLNCVWNPKKKEEIK